LHLSIVRWTLSWRARSTGPGSPVVPAWLFVAWLGSPVAIFAQTSPFDLTIEELGELPVVSMGRRAEDVRGSAAAVYVITSEDIRRSGVRTLPEALRLAPGIEVARNGTSSWTISMRGFNSDLSNKLLVLIDGRSVYSPLFGGVFWDAQDTLLADIDRIEVIAGPGGTIWGANAVNGVINIITRSAADTGGLYAEVGGGAGEDVFAGVRYGAALTDRIDARAYVKYFNREISSLPDGAEVRDEWTGAQSGFNLRWAVSESDGITLRGDVYDGSQDVLTRGDFTIGTIPPTDVPATVDLSGHNVVARWRRTLVGGGGTRLQVDLDHTNKKIPGSFNEKRDTYHLDFQHDLSAFGRHRMTWGAGLRRTSDDLDNTLFASFVPERRTDRLSTAFIQDRIAFEGTNVDLTIGSKLEHNEYTGFEYQPSGRMLWTIDATRAFWASASRAVRTPARLNTDLSLFAPITDDPVPFYINVVGDPEFLSEELMAYESGYRFQTGSNLSIDLAVFRNDYDNLQTQEVGTQVVETTPVTHIVLPVRLDNNMQGDTYGGRVAVAWQPLQRWRLRLHYSRLEMDLKLKPSSTDTPSLGIAGQSPAHQAAVHTFGELGRGLSVYMAARYVDALPSFGLPSRVAVDASFAWAPSPELSVSLTLRDLNDARHVEFGGGLAIERTAYLSLIWRPTP